MNTSPENIDQLIVKSFANEASPEDLSSLETWRSYSVENEKYYKDLLFIYESSAQINDSRPVDVDAAWNNVKRQIGQQGPKVVPIYPGKQSKDSKVWYAAAASLLLVCGLALVWYTQSRQETWQMASASKPASYALTDGSQVTLEAHSSLVQKTKGKREYVLQGQASFNVVHDEKDPFVIHTDEAMIKDIGTVFKVSYLPKNDTVRVRVTEGVVQFYTLIDDGIMLTEGESGYYLRSSKRFYKYGTFKDSNAVRHTEDFENARLEEVVDRLRSTFRQEIIIESEAIKNCRLTAHFENNSLREILDVISETLGVWQKEKEGKILLGGRGCN